MTAHKYFTVEPTSLTIPEDGALAIFCGDAPRLDETGRPVAFSLRMPILILPPGVWKNPEAVAEDVARVLNESAHVFFSSAKGEAND